MARHQLIAAQLATLTARLPAAAVCELVQLADGYDETFQTQLREHQSPDAAAAATIAQFGDADTITEAFVRHSPGRRLALRLLAPGPAMGLLRGATLVSQHAWNWPVPTPARVLYGAALLAVVATLIIALRDPRANRRTRLTTTGCAAGLLILDTLMLTAAAKLDAVPGWALSVAVAASLARITSVARALPAVLAE